MLNLFRRRTSRLPRALVALAANRAPILQALQARDFPAVNTLLGQSIEGLSVSIGIDSRRSAGAAVPCWTASRRGAVFGFHDSVYAGATELIFSRWLDFLPVVIRTMESASPQGACLVNLGDEGHAPGLAFCDTRPEYDLVPDSSFLLHRGYAAFVEPYTTHAVLFQQRAPVAFWRGVSTGVRTGDVMDLPRVRLCLLGRQMGAKADIGLTRLVLMKDEDEAETLKALNILTEHVPMDLMQHYQVQIDIDGNTNSWPGLLTKLHTGSPVVKVESPLGFRQWYYDRLVPWDNYVPVRSDMSDLEEKIDHLLTHPKEAQEIGRRGQALAQQMSFDREVNWAVPVASAALRRGAALAA